LLHELRGDFSLNACVIHPFDLCKVQADANPGNSQTGSGTNAGAGMSANPVSGTLVDVHGGRSETSVMLALAPDLVRRDLIAQKDHATDPQAVRSLIFDRGATFPWRTDDPRVAHTGIVGD